MSVRSLWHIQEIITITKTSQWTRAFKMSARWKHKIWYQTIERCVVVQHYYHCIHYIEQIQNGIMQTECAAFSSGIHEKPFSTLKNWSKKPRLIYINKRILTGVIANFYSLDSWNIEFTFTFAFAFGMHKDFDWCCYIKGTSKCCHLLHLSLFTRVCSFCRATKITST